jgi:hypothetical protein
MIKKIKNSKGNADSIFDIVEKANENFEYLENKFKDLPDYKKENFLKKEEYVAPTIKNIEGLKECFEEIAKQYAETNARMLELDNDIKDLFNLLLENVGSITKVNKQLIDLQNKIK